MTITGTRWANKGNIFTIRCDCGQTFEWRNDAWWVLCASCGAKQHLSKITKAEAVDVAAIPPVDRK